MSKSSRKNVLTEGSYKSTENPSRR